MGRLSIINFFIESGIDINYVSSKSEMALSVAIKHGFTKTAEVLLMNSAYFDLRIERDFKALEVAINKRDYYIVILLLNLIQFLFKILINSIAKLLSSKIYLDTDLQQLSSTTNKVIDGPPEVIENLKSRWSTVW